MSREIQPGDWIAFYQNARIVIAEVRYRRYRENYPHGYELLTESGAIDEKYVIEIRPRPPVGPTATPTEDQ